MQYSVHENIKGDAMKGKYESEAMQVIHEEMMDMHRCGFISDERMREFDEICFGKETKTRSKTKKSPKKEPVTTT